MVSALYNPRAAQRTELALRQLSNSVTRFSTYWIKLQYKKNSMNCHRNRNAVSHIRSSTSKAQAHSAKLEERGPSERLSYNEAAKGSHQNSTDAYFKSKLNPTPNHIGAMPDTGMMSKDSPGIPHSLTNLVTTQ